MPPTTMSLALLLQILLLRPTIASPAPLPHRVGPDLPQSTSSCADDAIDCNRPFDASVYICENINFQPPCTLLHLDVVNFAEYDWGPGGNAWPSNLVGSWGPAPGIATTLFTQQTDDEITYLYPGTTDVGDFWRTNLWSFQAEWNPSVDPATLPETVAAVVPAPTATARVMKRGVEISDERRPWWIHVAEN